MAMQASSAPVALFLAPLSCFLSLFLHAGAQRAWGCRAREELASLQRLAQWLPLASDHGSEAAQEAREEDYVTAPCRLVARQRRMRRMDGFSLSWIALVALALHLAVYGCSAVNLEGMHYRCSTLVVGLVLTRCASGVACAGSALLKFQSRVGEDPHGAMAGWNPRDGDPCSWNGVSCDDGRVVMLWVAFFIYQVLNVQ
jgi:hypothetical protein